MKKSLKILPLALIMLSAVSCQPTTSSSSSPKSETPASSQTASSTTPSSTTPSSSETPSVTPSVSPSETSSSEDTTQPITQTVDIASLVKHEKGETWETNDGFFKFNQIQADAGKTIKTAQTSDITKSKGVIQFTVTGAGQINLKAKSGSANTIRNLFVAKLTSEAIGEGATCEYIHQKALDNSAYVDVEFDLYEAGTYLIMSAASINITALSVTYTKGTTATRPAYTPELSDATRLDFTDIMPGTYSSTKISDNYTINGEVTYKGDRTIEGTSKNIKLFNNCLSVPALTAGVTFTATESGSISIWAIENEKTNTVKLGHKLSTDSEYTFEEQILANDSVTDGSKKPVVVTFSVTKDCSYDITCSSGSMSIFLIELTTL